MIKLFLVIGLLAVQPVLLNFAGGRILLLSRNKQSNPNSGIDAVTLKDGRCVLVCNPTHFERTPLEVLISMDQGKTWVRCLKLENGFGEYSYPSAIQASDGMIHIVYSWQRRKIKHVVIDPVLCPNCAHPSEKQSEKTVQFLYTK